MIMWTVREFNFLTFKLKYQFKDIQKNEINMAVKGDYSL